jgi:hypothetical protein
MSYLALRGASVIFFINAHASTDDKSDDLKYSFCETVEQMMFT